MVVHEGKDARGEHAVRMKSEEAPILLLDRFFIA